MAIFKPITDSEMLGIAEELLRKIKLVFPRFSLPVDESDRALLVSIWAKALSENVEYPRTVYTRAFDVLTSGATRDDNPPLPGDMLKACRIAVERMEADPVDGPKLRAWRDARKEARNNA